MLKAVKKVIVLEWWDTGDFVFYKIIANVNVIIKHSKGKKILP